MGRRDRHTGMLIYIWYACTCHFNLYIRCVQCVYNMYVYSICLYKSFYLINALVRWIGILAACCSSISYAYDICSMLQYILLPDYIECIHVYIHEIRRARTLWFLCTYNIILYHIILHLIDQLHRRPARPFSRATNNRRTQRHYFRTI